MQVCDVTLAQSFTQQLTSPWQMTNTQYAACNDVSEVSKLRVAMLWGNFEGE